MKKGLRKFVISASIVLAVAFAADWVLGKVVDRMLPAISNQGETGRTYFALNEVDYPILVVGSSRAAHHYVSCIMQDSLGEDVYNIGRDGCFFSYNCCVIQSILDRYTPKMIVWETSMNAFSSNNDPIESLYPYYGKNPFVTECVNIKSSWTERLPLVSNLYKYNSLLIRIVLRYVKRASYSDDEQNGYLPLTPKKWAPSEYKVPDSIIEQIDNQKIQMFKDVISMALKKGVRLIIVCSPSYMAKNEYSESEKIMQDICNSAGVTILNLSQAENIYDNIDFWCDYTHLNSKGAEVYTNYFIERINSLFD